MVAALAAGVAGCGDSSTSVEKIAFVAPGSDNDPDWTLQGKAVVAEFPGKLGVRVDIADVSKAGSDARGVLEQVAREDNQLVIAHDGRYADDAAEVAAETDVPALVWGERDEQDAPVAGITVEDKEGGYLAGITATMASYTRKLGVLIADDGSAWELATWHRTAGGFVAGARSVDPKVRIRVAHIGESGDATDADAYRATRRLIDDGAQIVLGLGGHTSTAMMRAINSFRGGGYLISVVNDKSSTQSVGNDGEAFLLGSLIWDVRATYRRAVRDVRDGSFGDHAYPLTLRNRGVVLIETGHMPSDAYEAAVDAEARVSSGEVDVPVTPTSETLEQLLAGEPPAG